MKITVSGYDFNRIMKTCVPATTKNAFREVLQFIEIASNGEEGCATALDGFIMAQTRFKCSGDTGKFLLFPCKPVPKYVELVEIKSEDGRVTVSYGDYSFGRKIPENYSYVDHFKIANDAQTKKMSIRIAVNPVLAKTIIKSLSDRNEPFFMDIYGDSDPIVVHTKDSVGLLLPMNVRRNVENPVFWKGEKA